MVTGVVPFPPRFSPLVFIAHRVQQSHCSSNFHRVLLTRALALSASQIVHKKKSPRIYTSMHSEGFELTKLTYTRLEDNLIRHWGDRTLYQVPGIYLYEVFDEPFRLKVENNWSFTSRLIVICTRCTNMLPMTTILQYLPSLPPLGGFFPSTSEHSCAAIIRREYIFPQQVCLGPFLIVFPQSRFNRRLFVYFISF